MMYEGEKELINALAKFDDEGFDTDLLEYATPTVWGCVFLNRLQGGAYRALKKYGCLNKVNREIRTALAVAYEANVEKNKSFYKCVNELSRLLKQLPFEVAMLKGAVLCGVYPEGYRTSNDIDLLVLPANVTELGNALQKEGFRQGYIRNEMFVPATRSEVISSRMLRGEVVPYIKEVNMPEMRYLEIDINFSLDYKNSDATCLKALLERNTILQLKDIQIPTLSKDDFLIHLCGHLYKEATTLPWIKFKRDMTLYKYMDIYMLLNRMSDFDIDEFIERAKEINLEKECAFSVLQTTELLKMEERAPFSNLKRILKNDPNYLHRVYSPEEKCTYVFRTKKVRERFFMENRINDLKKEDIDETA